MALKTKKKNLNKKLENFLDDISYDEVLIMGPDDINKYYNNKEDNEEKKRLIVSEFIGE